MMQKSNISIKGRNNFNTIFSTITFGIGLYQIARMSANYCKLNNSNSY